jgi:hypothetical protein
MGHCSMRSANLDRRGRSRQDRGQADGADPLAARVVEIFTAERLDPLGPGDRARFRGAEERQAGARGAELRGAGGHPGTRAIPGDTLPGLTLVSCRRNGARIAKITNGFVGCAQAAGLDDVHPHDLCRTFGSWLVQAGVGIERVSELLRHGDVAITARVHARLRPGDLADAVAILDRPEPARSVTHLHTGPEGAEEEKEKPTLVG